ncbi:MAG: hypothetical protein DRN05_03885 [Thermoplasmata archaeon]|nr:MAG: hypothetical protein DRN05_03885 [Thermoplasmata archaeon]
MGENHRMKKVLFLKNTEHLHDALHSMNIQRFTGKKTLVKLHMGEIGNKYFIKPDFIRRVVEELKKIDAHPFLFDTTVAYNSLRKTKKGYEKLAGIHGFTEKKIGCPIVISDRGVSKTVENRVFEVANELADTTHVVVVSHVKGHIQTGMGGAIKNLGMGGVTRETKIMIHNGSKPVYYKDKCIFCGLCAEICPFKAIKVDKKNWKRSEKKCFGCGLCVDVCENNALKHVDANIQYLLALSAKACVEGKNVVYINVLKNIARSCDCDPSAGPIICPDIGYLVSDDPVAIDKASLDLINHVRKNVFEKTNKVDPYRQIKYGEDVGLGTSSYQIVEL